MSKFLSSPPVLWFLFLFNLAVAVLAGFLLEQGVNQLVTCIGMGAVSLGAGAALVRRRARRSDVAVAEAVSA